MPNVGDTTTHNASNNGNPTGTYGSWGINPGSNGSEYNITPGTGGTTSSITVQWLVAGNYTISVEATNTCSSDIGFSPTIVVTGPPPCLLSISVSTSGSNINSFINSSNASDTVDISYNNGVSWSTGIDPIAIPNIVQSGFANGSYDVCVRQSSNFSCQQCQTVTVANCVPNWVDDGINFTCGGPAATHPTHPQAGLDACTVYKGQIDGCGNFQWVFDHTENTCGGCVPDPCTVCNNNSNVGINGPGVVHLDDPYTMNAIIDFPTCATYAWSVGNTGGGPVPNQPFTGIFTSGIFNVGDVGTIILTVSKPGCPPATSTKTITVIA